jgi:hypothetical protein
MKAHLVGAGEHSIPSKFIYTALGNVLPVAHGEHVGEAIVYQMNLCAFEGVMLEILNDTVISQQNIIRLEVVVSKLQLVNLFECVQDSSTDG